MKTLSCQVAKFTSLTRVCAGQVPSVILVESVVKTYLRQERTGVERRRYCDWSVGRGRYIQPGMAVGEPQVVASVSIILGVGPGQLFRPAIVDDFEYPEPDWLAPW